MGWQRYKPAAAVSPPPLLCPLPLILSSSSLNRGIKGDLIPDLLVFLPVAINTIMEIENIAELLGIAEEYNPLSSQQRRACYRLGLSRSFTRNHIKSQEDVRKAIDAMVKLRKELMN